ncbi:MAG: site-specific integrase [Lutibacter sp.]
MATVNFLYRSTKDKANLHLRLLYRFNEIDFVFGANTKYEVSKIYWSKQHKKKSKDVNITNLQKAVNSELDKIENHILTAFNSVNPDDINKEWLQTQIDYYYNPPQQAKKLPTDLLKYFDIVTENKKSKISKDSIKRYNSVKQLLDRYQQSIKKPILLNDVNNDFQNDFEKYCVKNKYAQNTITKAIKVIKTVCNDAKYNGLVVSYQLEKIKAKYVKIDKIYLTFDELEIIENIDKSKLTESLENTKDWLIISCYTGQRVSDFMRFTKDMIRIENGKHLIEFTQKKTNKIMTVPLHPKVLEILNKRNGMFPYAISDQKYNDYIKDVCEIAELNQLEKGSKILETAPKSGIFRKKTAMYKKYELITSHIGRRSFATNFYGTIPTSYLIYVTGHSTEVMFLNYIGKSNKDLAMEMTNFF